MLKSKLKNLKLTQFYTKNCSIGNMKKTGLNGYVYDLSVDYDVIAVDDISDIHKYFIKKNGMK